MLKPVMSFCQCIVCPQNYKTFNSWSEKYQKKIIGCIPTFWYFQLKLQLVLVKHAIGKIFYKQCFLKKVSNAKYKVFKYFKDLSQKLTHIYSVTVRHNISLCKCCALLWL